MRVLAKAYRVSLVRGYFGYLIVNLPCDTGAALKHPKRPNARACADLAMLVVPRTSVPLGAIICQLSLVQLGYAAQIDGLIL